MLAWLSGKGGLLVIVQEDAVLERGRPRGVMAKVLDCSLEVSEFELQSNYYV